MTLALTVGALTAGAVHLLLQRDLLRVVLGAVLLSHAVNLLLFASGGVLRRDEPLGADLDPATTADPLPQAFVLTAIVIAFAITIYLLVLAVTGRRQDVDGSDDDGREEAA
ncbi:MULTISPECIES: sodium:proton antiporter [Cellulomonas]|uniref:sodium:proton antiporter n=1 Tax=Cellulomonas TaxID=1707 RepID=UPI0010A90D19|nr:MULTISPECIES: cation:proton antiporter subunit C [Cellulomonas]